MIAHWQKTRFSKLGRLLLRQLLAGALLAGVLTPAANAEQILAAIVTSDLPRYQRVHEALVTVLQNGGFGEDKVKIFKQNPNADKMSLVNSLRRAEAAGAALVVTYGSQATTVAQEELKKTPLLFADVYDPVALGTVKTLAAPGRDASGATSKTELATLVESLLAMKPFKKLAVLYTRGEKGSELQLAELEGLAKKHGFVLVAENARNPKEAQELGDRLAAANEALFLTESIAVAQQAKEILASGQTGKCLFFSQIPGLVKEGALIGLEADLEEQGKLVAVHALQVLQGQKAHILPVREARQVSLNINSQAAARLGLTVPLTLASQAKML